VSPDIKRFGEPHTYSQRVCVTAMQRLLQAAPDNLEQHLMPYFRGRKPPFELKEIEHSLCEFDKWARVTGGEGRPRRRFHPGV